MPLGGDGIPEVVKALNRAAPFMRRLMGQKMKLKRLPGLRFEADRTFEEAAHIETLLKAPLVARDLKMDTGATDTGDSGDGA
jgi:ribosome-binding factor A